MGRFAGRALLASALVCVASEAGAQEANYQENTAGSAQNVVFDDDPLSGWTEHAIGAQIAGFHPPRRVALLRPRSSFVTELLKTVEAL